MAIALGLAMAAPAQGEVTPDTWVTAASATESADRLAEALSGRLADKLLAERSQVVFLDVHACRGRASPWCESFTASLQRELVSRGISFLPESSANELRAKIAAEQLYQQNSLQVDLAKAVELGKQKAVQAFVAVHLLSEGEGQVSAHASSVNIRDAVVSIVERATLNERVSTERSSGTMTRGLVLVGLGLGGAGAGLAQARLEKRKGDGLYAIYQSAKNEADAVVARKKSQAQDRVVNAWYGAAALGGALAAYGIYHMVTAVTPRTEYRVSLAADARPVDRRSRQMAFDWTPLVAPDGAGVVVELSW